MGNPLIDDGLREDPDLEMLFLSCLMNHPDHMVHVRFRILPDDLKERARQEVFEMMFKLYDRGTPPDKLALIREFRKMPDLLNRVGGEPTLEEIARYETTIRVSEVVDLAQLPSWAAELRTLHSRRVADAVVDEIQGLADDAKLPAPELWQEIRRRVSVGEERALLSQQRGFESVFSPHRLKEFHDMTTARLAGERPGVVPTGLDSLDDLLGGGLYRKHLYILGGRPAMGKTAMVENIGTHVVASGMRFYFASLEMKWRDLLDRMLTREARVDGLKHRLGQLTAVEQARVLHVLDELARNAGLPFQVMDQPAATLSDIQAMLMARSMFDGEPDLIALDYVELVGDVSGSGDWEGKTVVGSHRRAKVIADMFNAPFLVLSQLSRAVEYAEYKMPVLEHLRWGGEAEADAVLLMYWPWKLWMRNGRQSMKFPLSVRLDAHGQPLENDLHVMIPKARYGKEGVALLHIEAETGSIRDSGTTVGSTQRKIVSFSMPPSAGTSTSGQEDVDDEEAFDFGDVS